MTMLKGVNLNLITTTKQKNIPVIKIIDDCEYITTTKVIADVHIVGPNGEMKRRGKFLKTKKGGYMYG